MSLHCLGCCVFLLTWEYFFFLIQIVNQQDFYSSNTLALKRKKNKLKKITTPKPTSHFIHKNFN